MSSITHTGPIVALFEIYSQQARVLQSLISRLSCEIYEHDFDAETQDPDCRSIQTIFTHVIRSGFGYANYIRDHFDKPSDVNEIHLIPISDVTTSIDELLAYTKQALENHWGADSSTILSSTRKALRDPTYTLEQILEHAIVHILRHCHQAENALRDSQQPQKI